MALVKGTNSYATVAEANTYFADRTSSAEWTAAGATVQAQALVTATSILDDQTWVGTAVSESQLLAFPRVGDYFDPRLGTYATFDDTDSPTRLLNATYELALHLISNDNIQDDTGSVVDLTVGEISLTQVKKANLIPSRVQRVIKPMLLNGGSRAWWRAN